MNLRSPSVTRVYTWFFLPALFTIVSISHAINLGRDWTGIDARIYYQGSAAWLAGTNPWDAYSVFTPTSAVLHYYALPTMVVIGAPFVAVLSEPTFVLVVIAASMMAGIYAIRRIGLPLYWILWPPMIEGIFAGNPSIILLACLVSASPVVKAIAPLLKVYAVIPLLLDRRALRYVAIAFVASIVTWPLWVMYVTDFGARNARLALESQGGMSATGAGVLLGVLAIVALWRVDRKAALWLAVPAIWPASQLHYSTMAMPVMHPILAIGLMPSTPGLPTVVIAIYAAWRLSRQVMGTMYAAKSPPDVPAVIHIPNGPPGA